MFLSRLFLLFFLLLSISQSQAAAPSGEEWFTFRSANFTLHHTKPLEEYARAIAIALERALPLQEQNLKWKAPTPIDIVVMDPSDSANGLAVNFPNTHIELFSVPFEPDSTLSYYVNWVDELAIHELTHIIANDTTRGAYTFLRKIFGSWVKPNGLQPVWIMEGLAVYQETSLSSGGRGRSPLLETILRTASQEKKINSDDYLSLDRFNVGTPWWPAGNTPYLMGYTIQAAAQSIAKKNVHIPGELSQINSVRFPFMPNANIEELQGRDWKTIWSEVSSKLEKRYGEKIHENNFCRLTHSGRFTGGQALAPNGWIYFSEEDKENGFYLSRVFSSAPCGNTAIERIYQRRFEAPTQVAVSSDGKEVAFIDMEFINKDKLVGDLYLWNSETKKTTRLTKNKRAKDPSFSGRNLLFVVNKGGAQQAIVQKNLINNEEKELFAAQRFERISGLSANDKQLVFSLHNNKGSEKIYKMNFIDGKAEPLSQSKTKIEFERNAHLLSDGNILFAGSYGNSQQGIYLYSAKTKKSDPILLSPSGFLDRPIQLPDGNLLVQGYSLDGFDLYRAKPSLQPALEQKQDLHEFLTGAKPFELEKKNIELSPSLPYSATNSPATSMWPQYWMPELTGAENGYLIGASTGGNDPLEYYKYGGILQYDSRAKFPTYQAFFENRSNPINLHIEALQKNSYFISSKQSNRSTTYSAQVSLPYTNFVYSFGSAFQERSLFNVRGQNILIFQDFNYNNISKTPFAMNPNSGQALNLFVSLYPNSRNEKFFADIRPKANFFFQGISPTHSVSISAFAGFTTNRYLASNYYLGGGVSNLSPSSFIVRGYPVDTLLGQKIITSNFSYTIPLSHPYRGWHTNPVFLSALGLKFNADAGTANYLATYRGNIFQNYLPQKLGQKNIFGFGIDLLANGSIFYQIPVTATLGLHRGVQSQHGGETSVFFGIGAGTFGAIGERSQERLKNF